MANPKNQKAPTTAPAGASAPAAAPAAAPATKNNGFERGKEYEPDLKLADIDLSEITFRKRGVQTESKYKDLLDEAATLLLGKGFIVTEQKAEGVVGQVLFQRLSPYIRRHAQTANPNGALTVRLIDHEGAEVVVICCVPRESVQAPKKRAPKGSVVAAPTTTAEAS